MMDSAFLPSVPFWNSSELQSPTARAQESAETSAVPETRPHNERYQNDARLVQACLQGNQQAWNELVKRYQRLVYTIPRQYGLSTAEAEDVMQNVFLIVFRRLETLRDETRLSAWLIRVTHRATLGYLKQRRTDDDELQEEMTELEMPEDRHLEWLETQNLVRQALDRLDGRTSEILEACLADPPPSYAALARQLGCPVGSIGPTRARAFKKLQAVLREMEMDLS